MTRPLPFTQAAIKRAVCALEAVGKTVQGVEVLPNGSFRVLTGEAPQSAAFAPEDGPNEWDVVLRPQ